jgi:CRP/FNR family transcriptional regulator
MVFERAAHFDMSEPASRTERPAPGVPLTLQTVSTGARLFKAGDSRHAFRVEKGALCHYVVWKDGRHDVVEFAFPGDIVGLGTLDHHVSTAQAMVDTVVSDVSEAELARRMSVDALLALKAASAYDVEFDYIRQRAQSEDRGGPVKRLARYLCAVMAISESEGHSGDVIAEEVASGYVANALGMSLDALTEALVKLKADGLIINDHAGLRIIDRNGLEVIAAAA